MCFYIACGFKLLKDFALTGELVWYLEADVSPSPSYSRTWARNGFIYFITGIAKLCSRKEMLMPGSAHSMCQNKWEKVPFTCTQPAANMQKVTNARSTDDQENKDNKSADFADRLFSYRVSAQKYPISSVQHVCGVLMKTVSAAISEATITSP